MSSLQQVNLYHMDLRPKKEPFTFKAMIWSWCLIIVLLALFQALGWYQVQSAKEQLVNMQKQQAAVLLQLKNLRDATPRKNKAQVENRLNIVKAGVSQRQQLLNIMEGQSVGNLTGFSDHLIGLSRQHMSGLSIESFDLVDGGSVIELSGWAHKPELLPEYIQRLKSEGSFEGAHFGEMAFERIEQERADALRFSLTAAGDSR